MHYISRPEGNLIEVMLYGVEPVWIKDNSRLNDVIRKSLDEERYDICGELVVPYLGGEFPGYTGVFVISESALTYHTYLEHESIELALDTCRGPDAGWVTMDYAIRQMMPKSVFVRGGITPIIKNSVDSGMDSSYAMHSDTDDFLRGIEGFVKKSYECMERRFGDKDGMITDSARTHLRTRPRI